MTEIIATFFIETFSKFSLEYVAYKIVLLCVYDTGSMDVIDLKV